MSGKDEGAAQPLPYPVMRRALIPALCSLALLACGGDRPKDAGAPQARQPEATVSIVYVTPAPRTPSPPPTPAPPKLCLLTRQTGIAATYVPPNLVTLPKAITAPDSSVQLRQDAADAVSRLIAAAREDGQVLVAVSGYRSYEYQAEVLRQEIRTYGEERARKQVAEPGHSEHQLGVALDIAPARRPFDLEEAFGDTPEGRWVALHAPEFGFVISYPQGKEAITGYIYEPWHVRYVGLEVAQQMTGAALTLNEYLPRNGMAACPPDATVERQPVASR